MQVSRFHFNQRRSTQSPKGGIHERKEADRRCRNGLFCPEPVYRDRHGGGQGPQGRDLGPFTGPSAKTGEEFKGSVTWRWRRSTIWWATTSSSRYGSTARATRPRRPAPMPRPASASGSRVACSTGTVRWPWPPWTWPPSTRCPTCSASGPPRWSTKNGAAILKNTATGAARAGRFPLNSCPVMPRASTTR